MYFVYLSIVISSDTECEKYKNIWKINFLVNDYEYIQQNALTKTEDTSNNHKEGK